MATAIAITEKIRFARAVRSFHQTTQFIRASVRHAPLPIDQMTVTQLMASCFPVYTAAIVSGGLTFRTGKKLFGKQQFALCVKIGVIGSALTLTIGERYTESLIPIVAIANLIAVNRAASNLAWSFISLPSG